MLAIKLEVLGVSSPILQIARRLEEVALEDPYFIQRKPYPTEILQWHYFAALAFHDMLTVLFHWQNSGWLSHWKKLLRMERKSTGSGRSVKETLGLIFR